METLESSFENFRQASFDTIIVNANSVNFNNVDVFNNSNVSFSGNDNAYKISEYSTTLHVDGSSPSYVNNSLISQAPCNELRYLFQIASIVIVKHYTQHLNFMQ